MTTTTLTTPRRGRSRWVDLALLVLLLAIFAVPLSLRLGTDGQPEGEAYAGSDSSATTRIEQVDPSYKPWFSPVFQASSGEVESGLFALQAAIGAGVLGFAFGRLSARSRRTPAGSAAATGEPPA